MERAALGMLKVQAVERRGGGEYFISALEMLLLLTCIPRRDSGKCWWSVPCFLEADKNLYGTALGI